MSTNKTTDNSRQQSNQRSLYEAYPHMRFTICRMPIKESDVHDNWIRRLWIYFWGKG
jgi:hypothetical protein